MPGSPVEYSAGAARPSGRSGSSRLSRRRRLAVAILVLLALGLLDRAWGELRLAVFYLVPIGYAAWVLGRRAGHLLAVMAATQWLFESLRAPGYGAPYENTALRLGFFLAVASILASLRARARQQAAVAELNATSLAGDDVYELMRHAARLVVANTEAQRARVFEATPGKTDWTLRAVVGWPASSVGATGPAGSGLAAGVQMLHDPPLVVRTLRRGRPLRGFELLGGDGIVSTVSVAIGSPVEILGVVTADGARRAHFTGDDLRFLGVVASVVAQMLLRRRFEAEAQESRVRQVVEMNDHVVQGLAAALYALQTRQYSTAERTVEFTLEAARTMMRDLPVTARGHRVLAPGDLVRDRPAVLPLGVRQPLPAGVPYRGAKIRVVLADDTPSLRSLVRGILDTFAAGEFEVVAEAGDGSEAVRAVAETTPDVILLDLAMPGMSGLEAIPEIRAASPRTKIVVFSGFHRDQVAAEVNAAGADSHLEKGIAPAQLVGVLRGVVTDRVRLRVVETEPGDAEATTS